MTTTPRTPADVLREMRDLLAVPERWTQGAEAKNEDGEPTALHASAATCWCLVGACLRLSPSSDLYTAAIDVICKTAGLPWGGQYVVGWNDTRDRTHAEVLALLDRAIEVAEGAR